MSAESCAGISNLDVLSACVYLETKISESSLSPIWAGIIGFLAAVVAAAVAAYSNHRIKKTERITMGERQAIIAVQDFADELRARWKTNLVFLESLKVKPSTSEAPRSSPFPDLDQAKETGTLKKLISRVRSEQVRVRYAAWMTYAEQFYSDSDETQAIDEEDIWAAASDGSGTVLRDLDSWTVFSNLTQWARRTTDQRRAA